MSTKQIVEEVLRNHPAARSSDKLLRLEVYAAYGLELTPRQEEKFFDLPSDETITRIRRKIQEEGNYQATETVKRHRRIKSQEVQQRMPKTRPEKVDQLINGREYENPIKPTFEEELDQMGLFGERRQTAL